MTKYQKLFSEMMDTNRKLFDEFKKVHRQYLQSQAKNQKEFDEVGKKVLEVIREYEKRLCSKSENTGYGRFSANLSEKLWTEIRKYFPLIDFVGTKVSK